MLATYAVARDTVVATMPATATRLAGALAVGLVVWIGLVLATRPALDPRPQDDAHRGVPGLFVVGGGLFALERATDARAVPERALGFPEAVAAALPESAASAVAAQPPPRRRVP